MARASAQAVKHLTETELAERLGVHVTTVKQWRQQSRGPAYIKAEGGGGGTVRYRLADVEAWEESRLVKPAAP